LKEDAIHPNEQGQMSDSIDILNLPTLKIFEHQFLDSQKKV